MLAEEALPVLGGRMLRLRDCRRRTETHRVRRAFCRVVAAAVAATALPAVAHPLAAGAFAVCRPTVAVTAPKSAPVQHTVNLTVRVRSCDNNDLSGDCTLEQQVAGKFVLIDSGTLLGAGNCDFPTSSNTAATITYRVRYTGDRFHAPASSRNFTVTFAAEAKSGDSLRLSLAFVDSTVTAQGGRASMPKGLVVFAPGSTVTGTTGCPTTSFGQDGLMVLVLDYAGPPTNASVTTTINSPGAGSFSVAPYYLDLNPGKHLQYLGPRTDNGTYDIVVEYGYARSSGFSKVAARFVLNRKCSSS